MKWLLISESSEQEIYELQNSSEKLLTLAFHPSSGTLRISSNDEKRVFLIGREGFLRRRTVLRNEYGIRVGQYNSEGQDSQGIVDIDDEHYNFVVQNTATSKAAVYRNNEIVLVCDLPTFPKNNTGSENHDLLLVMLCWYLSTTVKKGMEEYA